MLVAGAVPLLLAGALRLERVVCRHGGADVGRRRRGAGGATRGRARDATRRWPAFPGGVQLDPWRDFFARYGTAAALILALVCVYRLSELVRNVAEPVLSGSGVHARANRGSPEDFRRHHDDAGSARRRSRGGAVGILRAFAAGAVFGPFSSLVFAWLATQGDDLAALVIATAIENVGAGFAGTCLIAHVQPHLGQLHSNAVRVLLLALRVSPAGCSRHNQDALSRALRAPPRRAASCRVSSVSSSTCRPGASCPASGPQPWVPAMWCFSIRHYWAC